MEHRPATTAAPQSMRAALHCSSPTRAAREVEPGERPRTCSGAGLAAGRRGRRDGSGADRRQLSSVVASVPRGAAAPTRRDREVAERDRVPWPTVRGCEHEAAAPSSREEASQSGSADPDWPDQDGGGLDQPECAEGSGQSCRKSPMHCDTSAHRAASVTRAADAVRMVTVASAAAANRFQAAARAARRPSRPAGLPPSRCLAGYLHR